MQALSFETLAAIANTHGTPVYVYDADKISQQYRQLKTAFQDSDTRFFYACKSLTNINILKHVAATGCDIDCSSINEAKLALHVGVAPNAYSIRAMAFIFLRFKKQSHWVLM